MRKNLFIASIAAALSLCLAGPVAAQSNEYTYKGRKFDLKSLERLSAEPKRGDLGNGEAKLITTGCNTGYVKIVIRDADLDKRHRDCIQDPK